MNSGSAYLFVKVDCIVSSILDYYFIYNNSPKENKPNNVFIKFTEHYQCYSELKLKL